MRRLSLLSISLALPMLACAGSDAPVEYPESVTADPDHYTVEFENDAVRLLRIAYGPGETSVMHTHPANCSVALTTSTWSMETPDGETTEDGNNVGDLSCNEGSVHLPTNTGSEAAEVILIEFKDGAMAGSADEPEFPNGVAADPDHYSSVFENDAVRIVEVHYGPGEASSMHSHPAHCVIFVSEESAATFELPDGEIVEAGAPRGTIQCNPAAIHLPTNVGDGDTRVVLVEMKGRAETGV